MSIKKMRQEALERTKNITPVCEMPIPVEEGRRLPRTGVGLTTALFLAHDRIRILEDMLRGLGEEIGIESMHQKSHNFTLELKNCWSRIDSLEAKLRQHGLSIPNPEA